MIIIIVTVIIDYVRPSKDSRAVRPTEGRDGRDPPPLPRGVPEPLKPGSSRPCPGSRRVRVHRVTVSQCPTLLPAPPALGPTAKSRSSGWEPGCPGAFEAPRPPRWAARWRRLYRPKAPPAPTSTDSAPDGRVSRRTHHTVCAVGRDAASFSPGPRKGRRVERGRGSTGRTGLRAPPPSGFPGERLRVPLVWTALQPPPEVLIPRWGVFTPDSNGLQFQGEKTSENKTSAQI